MISHPIPPVYDENSRVLVLGSFPSVKSREQGFFYGHPSNRFWRVLSALAGKEVPSTIDQKRTLLLSMGIAVWDVIQSCDITGSSDSSIKNVIPNDLTDLLNRSKVIRIFVNGKTAKKYYDKYLLPKVGIQAICLPSTSPANAICSLDKLISEWKIITE
ncbi:MAG: DNA-deoxyinosine glycosylase [Clostridia bacterium]|nr:DNA-deoxyinosine glycosylase [Clostridia bacterium]